MTDSALYARIAELPLAIESIGLVPIDGRFGDGSERLTTVVRLRGGGHEGLGEDATYDAPEQRAFRRGAGALPPLGRFTLGEWCTLLDGLDLFGEPPAAAVSRNYRRWAFEAAALDLALRQRGLSLAEAVGRTPQPLRFVCSMRLAEPATAAPVLERLQRFPGLRLKLDATSSWDDALIARIAATGAVDALDLKGAYLGASVYQPPDPALYQRLVEAFPEAWLEDPALTPETEAVLAAHRDRIAWDAPVQGPESLDALPQPLRALNLKPSRFGSLAALFAAYERCQRDGIVAYGGGLYELGPGRGQIQLLASLFHPDAANDTAPAGFNEPEPPVILPVGPLVPQADPCGFRWGRVAI